MDFTKQVSAQHYKFENYYTKPRWCSIWHQIDEVLSFEPHCVLEVGGGLGLFKRSLECFKVPVTTVDIADDLEPDVLGSILDLPFGSDAFDVVCAFQVLEHLPFADLMQALKELRRVAKNGVVVSIPNAEVRYGGIVTVPGFGVKEYWLKKPGKDFIMKTRNGEHHWELNAKRVSMNSIERAFTEVGLKLLRSFRVPENQYHHFFSALIEK